MSLRPGHARCIALLPGLLAAGTAQAACLSIASSPDGAPFAFVAMPPMDATFRLTYRHSVTRTPVEESYRVDDAAIVQTEIRFEEHGPGLPTEPDTGAHWKRHDGRYVVTLNRRFPRVVMRIDGSTHPALATAARTIDLAQWGDRALELKPVPEPCARP